MSRFAAALLAACLLLTVRPAAHEVPNEATVQTFLKPEGQTLVFLVRAPLKSMRDVDIPTKENGFVDLARIRPTLEDAAWLTHAELVRRVEQRPHCEVAALYAPRAA